MIILFLKDKIGGK